MYFQSLPPWARAKVKVTFYLKQSDTQRKTGLVKQTPSNTFSLQNEH